MAFPPKCQFRECLAKSHMFAREAQLHVGVGNNQLMPGLPATRYECIKVGRKLTG